MDKLQFLLLIYCIVSVKKYTTMQAVESYTVYNIDKNSYAMHYAYYKNYC